MTWIRPLSSLGLRLNYATSVYTSSPSNSTSLMQKQTWAPLRSLPIFQEGFINIHKLAVFKYADGDTSRPLRSLQRYHYLLIRTTVRKWLLHYNHRLALMFYQTKKFVKTFIKLLAPRFIALKEKHLREKKLNRKQCQLCTQEQFFW